MTQVYRWLNDLLTPCNSKWIKKNSHEFSQFTWFCIWIMVVATSQHSFEKVVASGHATLYSAMASSMNALSGPLHGRANQSCLEFVLRVGTSDPEEVERFVRGELEVDDQCLDLGTQFYVQKTQELQFSSLWVRKFVLKMKTSRLFEPFEKLHLVSSLKILKTFESECKCRYCLWRIVASCWPQGPKLLHHLLWLGSSCRHRCSNLR